MTPEQRAEAAEKAIEAVKSTFALDWVDVVPKENRANLLREFNQPEKTLRTETWLRGTAGNGRIHVALRLWGDAPVEWPMWEAVATPMPAAPIDETAFSRLLKQQMGDDAFASATGSDAVQVVAEAIEKLSTSLSAAKRVLRSDFVEELNETAALVRGIIQEA